jgi:hypothetical protein
MLESAHAVHRSRARLRLRVPARRHDATWFGEVERALITQPGIADVHVSPATGTLTLRLDAEDAAAPPVAARLAAAGLRLADDGAAPARRSARATTSLRLGSVRLRRRDLALGLFLLLLMRQLLRSGWLAPALALAWFLAETLPGRRR